MKSGIDICFLHGNLLPSKQFKYGDMNILESIFVFFFFLFTSLLSILVPEINTKQDCKYIEGALHRYVWQKKLYITC
jgi:hypothetical protein